MVGGYFYYLCCQRILLKRLHHGRGEWRYVYGWNGAVGIHHKSEACEGFGVLGCYRHLVTVVG